MALVDSRNVVRGLIGCLVVAGLAANPARADRQQMFRARADLSTIDVSVLDRDGRPVRGLTQADFAVFIDGVAHPVEAATEIEVPSAPATPIGWRTDVPVDVATNVRPLHRRVVAIVIDDAMLPPVPAILNEARRAAASVISHLAATDLASVIFTRDNRGAQDFTGDRARLLASIDTLSTGFAFGAPVERGLGAERAVSGDGYFYQSSVLTLRRVIDTLAVLEHERKNVVWIGIGLPLDAQKRSPVLAAGVGSGAGEAELQRRLFDELQQALGRAQRHNVVVHTLDPGGLDGLANYLFATVYRGRASWPAVEREAVPYRDYLRTVAEQTGGVAAVETNALDEGIAKIVTYASSYYLLGYQAAGQPAPGTVRRLEIRVARPDMVVGAARALVEPASTPPAGSPGPRAVAALLPSATVPLRLALIPYRGANAKTWVGVVLTLEAPRADARTAQATIGVFSPEGDADTRTQVRASLGAARAAGALEIWAQVPANPGLRHVRVGVSLDGAEAAGSVYATIDVPDFAREPLSLSGLVLRASPGLPAGPSSGIPGLAALSPTAQRRFGADDRLHAFAFVYGHADVLSTLRSDWTLLDARGGRIALESEMRPVAGSGGLIATALPRLAPGDYQLILDATAGQRRVSRAAVLTVH